MIIVDETKEFTFKNLCPYCKGDLTYTANGWTEDKNSLWVADQFDCNCSNEPPIHTTAWDEWLKMHSNMPYVYQLPVDQQVTEYISLRYRFKLK